MTLIGTIHAVAATSSYDVWIVQERGNGRSTPWPRRRRRGYDMERPWATSNGTIHAVAAALRRVDRPSIQKRTIHVVATTRILQESAENGHVVAAASTLCITGKVVKERRRTAWITQPGSEIGALAYSGKLMPPSPMPEAVRGVRDVWALGLFAAGQSSTMVCTYAGQVIMGGMVQIKLRPWKQIAMTRALALGPALAVAVSTYGDQRLFNRINEYLNVLQSVLPSPDAAAVLRRCDRRPIDT